jgi:hypothetical protein
MRKETTMWPTSYTFADIELRIAERQADEREAEFASYGDREFYGIRVLSEFDVEEFDSTLELQEADMADAAYELMREATFDPDYPN